MITIRPIEQSDVKDVFDMFISLFHEGGFPNVMKDEALGWKHLMEHATMRFNLREIFVAEVDGIIVGALKCFLSPYWYNEQFRAVHELLYVKPEFRQTEVAVALFTEFETWAARGGAVHITGNIMVPNGSARDVFREFMTKLQYKEVGQFYIKDVANVR